MLKCTFSFKFFLRGEFISNFSLEMPHSHALWSTFTQLLLRRQNDSQTSKHSWFLFLLLSYLSAELQSSPSLVALV